jgi:hypothetical protein
MLAIIIILLLLAYMVKQAMSKPVYWFHRKSCPYCVMMEDEWSKFCGMTTLSLIKPIAIDISNPKNAELSAKYNVQSVPTLIKVGASPYDADVYNGPRTAVDIYSWAIA